MDAKALPKTLYKYRSWHNEHHRRMLTDNEIYFASPASFNDPFDCQILFRYDLIHTRPLPEQIDYLEERLSSKEPTWSKHDRLIEAERLVNSGWFTDPSRYDIWMERAWKDAESAGVFSVAEHRDQILMWSHYANSHKGFCVGFDTKKIERFFCRLPRELFVHDALEVKYPGEHPVLIPSALNPEEFFKSHFELKAELWAYENEFRYVMQDVSDKTIDLPPDVISEVILGCEMPEEDKQEIISILKMRKHKPKLFQATKKELEFGLDIVPIDY